MLERQVLRLNCKGDIQISVFAGIKVLTLFCQQWLTGLYINQIKFIVIAL